MLLVAKSFVISPAHDGPGLVQPPPRRLVDRTLNVAQIRSQDGHFVLGRLPLVNNVRVPILREFNVGITLHGKVLPPVHPMTDVSREDRSDRQRGVHAVDIDPIGVPTQDLIRVDIARFGRLAAFGIALVDLIDHGDPDPFRMLGAVEHILHGAGALPIPVAADGNVDGFQLLRRSIGHGFGVVGADLGSLGRCYQPLAVLSEMLPYAPLQSILRWVPKFRHVQ